MAQFYPISRSISRSTVIGKQSNPKKTWIEITNVMNLQYLCIKTKKAIFSYR